MMMNTTLQVSLELDDVRPEMVSKVAKSAIAELTQTGEVKIVARHKQSTILTIEYWSLNRNEAMRTSEVLTGAIRPLVKRIRGTKIDRTP